ncbi:MAG: N-acetyltransferase [Chloroflexi bacterium]|nr:N-acetyltransferase [Chloroflexota bacterium]
MARANLMDTEAWIALGPRNLGLFWEHPARTMGQGWQRWHDVWAADLGSACPFANNATLLRPLQQGHEQELIDRLDGFFKGRPGGSWLLWSGWPTPDLGSSGCTHWGEPPLMVRLPGGAAPPTPPELRIVEARDAVSLRDFETVMVDGFPLPWLQPFRPGCLYDVRVLGGSFRIWVGYADERPVSVAAAYVDNRSVGVYCVATMGDARGRGYGSALTWAATLTDPALPAVLQASDDGRPVYERMGYTTVTRMSLWERARQTQASEVSRP